jgi:hypothetical protein
VRPRLSARVARVRGRDPLSVSPGLSCTPWWAQCTKLQKHCEVVADRPAFGDASVREPVGKGRVPDVPARRSVESAELAAWPVMLARAELHHHVVLGDDEVVHPSSTLNVTLSRPEELASPLQARRTAGGESIIDHVRHAQCIQAGQIATPVTEPIELFYNRLILRSVHSAIPPQRPRAANQVQQSSTATAPNRQPARSPAHRPSCDNGETPSGAASSGRRGRRVNRAAPG